ncbi:MAG: universal stress protein [Bacteroidia bacterium]
MKKILVPTDFSPAAHNAFEYALQLAESTGMSLELLHIIPPKPDTGKYPMPAWLELVDVERTDDALKHFRSYEQEVQVRLGQKVSVEIELVTGNPVWEIIHHSKYADLIVMGTQGIESAESKTLGSVTAQVIAKTSCSVLVIPEGSAYKPITNIVFGTTLDEEEIEGLDPLLAFAETVGAKLSFVHIEDKKEGSDLLRFSSVEQIYQIRDHQQEVGLYQLTHTDIISGLQIFVNHANAEIIAILSHHRDLWSKSIARDLAFYSYTPVLVLHQG